MTRLVDDDGERRTAGGGGGGKGGEARLTGEVEVVFDEILVDFAEVIVPRKRRKPVLRVRPCFILIKSLKH